MPASRGLRHTLAANVTQPLGKHAPRTARPNQPDPPLPASTALCSSWGQAERVLSFLRQPARPRKVGAGPQA